MRKIVKSFKWIFYIFAKFVNEIKKRLLAQIGIIIRLEIVKFETQNRDFFERQEHNLCNSVIFIFAKWA